MINKSILAMCLALVSSSSFSQSCNRGNSDAGDYVQPWEFCDDDFARRKVPSFNDYLADRVNELKPMLPQRFNGPDAEDNAGWLLAIRNAYNSGKYQFAGHYLFVERGGCGQGCHRAIIVDLKDGKIYQPREIALVAASVNTLPETLCKKLEMDCDGIFTVRKNSKLVVMVGALGDDTQERGFYFYKWDNNRLKLLSKVEKSPYRTQNKR